jgi:signal transduction histidine kinase
MAELITPTLPDQSRLSGVGEWEIPPAVGVARLLRIVATLWIGYILALAASDALFVALRPLIQPLPARYYVPQGLIALGVLGLSFWRWAQARLGRAFLPLVIVWMSALPILATALATRWLPPGPLTSAEGLALRLLPVLFMALVLVAWQYRWRHVVLFSLGTAALVIGSLGPLGAGLGSPIVPGTLAAVIQTISFLTVGYCICALMNRLRAQRASLEQANTQLRHYASTIERLTISRERNRVARELHDTLAHTLSALIVQLETTKAYWEVEPATARTMLATALDATRSGLQETRYALKALRASPLDDLGLGLALRRMTEAAASRANLSLDLALAEPLPVLAPDIEQCIYRIAQEAVANSTQHANAQQLTVRLECHANRLVLEVHDDGCGFDVHDSARPGHFGLAGMRERAELAGGQLNIASRPGQGATVRLII